MFSLDRVLSFCCSSSHHLSIAPQAAQQGFLLLLSPLILNIYSVSWMMLLQALAIRDTFSTRGQIPAQRRTWHWAGAHQLSPDVLLETQIGAPPGLQHPNTLDLTIQETGNANDKETLCSLSPWEQKPVLLTGSMASLSQKIRTTAWAEFLFSVNKQIFLLISSPGNLEFAGKKGRR